jgi:hypothetical protein
MKTLSNDVKELSLSEIFYGKGRIWERREDLTC